MLFCRTYQSPRSVIGTTTKVEGDVRQASKFNNESVYRTVPAGETDKCCETPDNQRSVTKRELRLDKRELLITNPAGKLLGQVGA